MTTVADIVTRDPGAARVFERHAIDYCCHGQRSLEDACDEAGISAEQVRMELAAVAGATPRVVPTDDVGGLIGHIVARHHTYLRRELPRLEAQMAKVVAAHAERHPEVREMATTLDALVADLVPHLAKEEQVLFPLAIQMLGAVEPVAAQCGSVRNPISVMHVEHDDVGELLVRMRSLTDDYQPPDDACPTWRALDAGLAELEADIHMHVHLENNVLFPKLVALESALVGAAG